MEVLIAAGNIKSGALFWIWDSIVEGFRENGYKSKLINQEDLYKIKNYHDISLIILDVSQIEIENTSVKNIIKKLALNNIKIICNYYLPEDFSLKRKESVLDLLNQNYLQFIIGEQGDEQAVKMNKLFNQKYFYSPQGVKKSTMEYAKNLVPNKDYKFDVVFIGGKLIKKKWLNENIIPSLKRRYNFYLHGYGWRKRDFFLKVFHKIGRITKVKLISTISQKFYKVITEEEEAALYRNSKVCINFHEREPSGLKSHRVLNQRVFKIAGCGGIQIVDSDNLIDDEFPEEFINQVGLNKTKWLKKIEDLINIDDHKREILRKKIINFSIDKHSTKVRAKNILKLASLPIKQ